MMSIFIQLIESLKILIYKVINIFLERLLHLMPDSTVFHAFASNWAIILLIFTVIYIGSILLGRFKTTIRSMIIKSWMLFATSLIFTVLSLYI